MDTAQHVFYIFGSIAFGLFALFVLIAIIAVLAIQRRISRLTRKINAIGTEIYQIIRDSRSYGRYLGASFASKIFGTLLRVFKSRNRERF